MPGTHSLLDQPAITNILHWMKRRNLALDEKEILKQKLDGNKISWFSEYPRPGTDPKLRVREAEEEFWRPHPLTHSLESPDTSVT